MNKIIGAETPLSWCATTATTGKVKNLTRRIVARRVTIKYSTYHGPAHGPAHLKPMDKPMRNPSDTLFSIDFYDSERNNTN